MSGCSRSPETAPLDNLRRRAELLERTRRFFSARGVLEVETPVLARGVIVERHIEPLHCELPTLGTLYLHTSPEAAMKRLVAGGSGPIFQIARVFRAGERGSLHNPEFTLLEWYRPGMDHLALMDEVADLVRELLAVTAFESLTYRQVFESALGLNPHAATPRTLQDVAAARGLTPPPGFEGEIVDAWLDWLMSAIVQPQLGLRAPLFIVDYPASQAALARIRDEGGTWVAERFELFYRGIELCNGYHELLDPQEHRRRFAAANSLRLADGREELPVDARFLAALESGLPECAGVALGFDRLVMLACGAQTIDDVLAFSTDQV